MKLYYAVCEPLQMGAQLHMDLFTNLKEAQDDAVVIGKSTVFSQSVCIYEMRLVGTYHFSRVKVEAHWEPAQEEHPNG